MLSCHPLLPTKYLNQGTEIDLGPNTEYNSDTDLSDFIASRIGDGFGYGGYLEDRSIYSISKVFSNESGFRNIHLGIDLWCKAYTSIHAPISGIVHSFKDNSSFGDYGPTIILHHHMDSFPKYSLYGHLSRASLDRIEIGQAIKRGEVFAELGEYHENHGWPPHLHFQWIHEIGAYRGDFPGVCSQNELSKYHLLCPDPLSFPRLLG